MKKILKIFYTWPEPKTNGAGVRMMQLIKAFQNKKFQISFTSAAEKTMYSEVLKPYALQEKCIKINDSSFDEFVKTLNPDIVLFDRFYTEEQFGWRVAKNCPQALRILDTEDLHFLRYSREEALKSKIKVNYKNSEIAIREIASIFRCDLSLIISMAEIELLKEEFKIDKSLLHYLPFIREMTLKEPLLNFNKRQHFIFLGNFKHGPNIDAVLELKNTIWPLISKQLPEAELHCYGAYASQKINQLHNPKERFFISGWAEDAAVVIGNARVMLAPLRFGAGLKRKLIEAMQYGTPSVTTKIGCEGISNVEIWNGYIEDDPDDFALKAIQLYTDKKSWQEAQITGFNILDKRFYKTQFESEFLNKITFLQKNLTSHRLNNFVGSLLMHHTMQSTKYMGKWIEEKNKPKN
ncbi:MAG: glycosyltransferase family 4 protein [Flavobacteriaceae bacterium]|nr:glycosyltransferase family 4 protein [Flavobacteriaceae bacterium]